MPYLYRNINLRENAETGKKHYVNVIYPDILYGDDDTYLITTSGDRLDLLADQFYKDSSLWWIINNANPDATRGDSFVCRLGSHLRIPGESVIPDIMLAFDAVNSFR
jgi:hypothetical protein